MILLTITLCVLMKTMAILAAERLAISSPISNTQKYFGYGRASNFYDTTSTPTPDSYHHHTIPSKSDTDTGIHAQENDHFNDVGSSQETLKAHNYTNKESTTASYLIKEYRFRPMGTRLPEAPPLFKRALQYIGEDPKKNED